jgi:hypothetical protein
MDSIEIYKESTKPSYNLGIFFLSSLYPNTIVWSVFVWITCAEAWVFVCVCVCV